MPDKKEGYEDVEITLTLEEWGRIALLAHKEDITINDMVTKLIMKHIEECKELLK